MSAGDVIWLVVVTYALVASVMVLYWLLSDIFRDPDSSGIRRVLWTLALICLPVVTAVVYLVVEGRDMTERYRLWSSSRTEIRPAT
jgi:Phospholipase_D-nuclease N-terminal